MEVQIDSLNFLEMQKAKQRWDSIAKPLNSLGKLEKAVEKLSGIFGTHNFDISKKCVVVMCADNGIVEEGISQVGKEVTLTVAENMTQNKATINILANECDADVFVYDVGIDAIVNNDKIINKKIMFGTNNFLKQPAMSKEQAIEAINVGISIVKDLKQKGYKMIATGEMGIGNTTTSSAITACLLNRRASFVTGRGAGLTDAALRKKVKVINKSLKLHKPNKNDPIDVLSKVGGLDIAALVGVFLGGGLHQIPILIDGFISSVAALLATKIAPEIKDFMFATHISKEPGGKIVLDELNLPFFIDLHMCLGEGTGAVVAFKIFDLAVSVYKNMTTFNQAKIPDYLPLAETTL